MESLWIVLGALLLAIVLWDTFETIVLSKTVRRRYSFSFLLANSVWFVWKFLVRRTRGSLRQTILVSFGPSALLLMIGMWAALLMVAFALIQFGVGTLPGRSASDYLYYSGVTFLTLGYGDIVSPSPGGHLFSVAEAGMGFGFLAVVIGYIPVMYGNFSRRETAITLLDSKAGSNPTAGELLRRHGEAKAMSELIQLLKDWELWSAQQLEATMSYPVLAYYRSQHDDQSWLNALTCILDTCSLIMVGFEDDPSWARPIDFQARATFAMGRHLVVDLAYVVDIKPDLNPFNRLDPRSWEVLRAELNKTGIVLRSDGEVSLAERRAMYEPYAIALAREMFFTLPAWLPDPNALDNWMVSAWEKPRHF